jgi:hypothetical protein
LIILFTISLGLFVVWLCSRGTVIVAKAPLELDKRITPP